jgi:hypothetical protein
MKKIKISINDEVVAAALKLKAMRTPPVYY